MKCVICSNYLIYSFSAQDWRHHSTDNSYKVYKCNFCWTESIYPTPTKEEQKEFYPKDYYSYIIGKKEKLLIKRILIKIYFFIASILRWVFGYWLNEKILKNEKWNFLDVWCWSWFLKDKVEWYWRKYFWFEVAWTTFKKDNIRYNHDMTKENFDWKKFDYIYMSHVFEHLDNPIATLDKLRNILNPNWVVHILLPNIDSYSAKLFGKYVAERDIPRHLFSYTKKWLDMLFISKWFKIVASKYVLQMCWYLSCMRLFKNEKKLKYFKFLRIPLWVLISFFDLLYSIFAKKTNQLQYYIRIKK